MHGGRFVWLAGCALVSAAAAQAVEIERAEDGSRVVEASAFLKPHASWFVLPPDLVEATAELDRVFDETRALLPPEYRGQIPDDVMLPEHVGIASWTGRAQGRATFFDAVELEAAWQAALVLSSSQAFGAGSAQAGVLGTALVVPERRVIDFDPYLLDEGTLRLHHNLDRLLVRWQTRAFALTVGRQAISWGTGRLWNPTDLVSPFSPTDVDREVRRGADAVRLSLPLAELTQMDVLWLPRQAFDEQGFVVRVQTNVWQTDISGSAAKYIDDLVLGADAAGDLGPLGVHAEVAWTLPIVDLRADDPYLWLRDAHVDGEFVRAVAGADWRPLEQLVLGAEYYWNGFGAEHAADVVAKLSDPRVVRGEVFGAGRHYVGVVASWLADDLVTLGATALVNVGDPGVLLVPAAEYWLEQRVLVRAGGFIPIAQGLDVATFRALGGADVIGNTGAFQQAMRTLGARSEYGLSPMGVFVQLGAYWH